MTSTSSADGRDGTSSVVIESYSEMIRYLDEDDPTTRHLLEEILASEEDHADDRRTLLETLGKDERGRRERAT